MINIALRDDPRRDVFRIECDLCGCLGLPFGGEDLVSGEDLALVTWPLELIRAALRRLAHGEGWRTVTTAWCCAPEHTSDVCPGCRSRILFGVTESC